MRSLFLKIFLWFWLASMLIAGSLVIPAIWMPLPSQVAARLRAMASTLLTPFGRGAVDVLERDGRPAVGEYIERLERGTNLWIFLFDESGEEVLGKSAPPGAEELAARAAKSGETEILHSTMTPLAAQPVAGSQQRRYVVVGKMPTSPLGEVLSDPRLWAPPMVVVMLMGGIVCYGLARHLTAPVRRLRDATQRLAGGDLAARVGATVGRRRDEIGDLGRDFDLMAERIESLMSAQRQLLQDISHELRSPLARLNVALGIAGRRAGPEAAGALNRIEREAERLNELIGQLLALTRLEGGTGRPETVRIELSEVVREIAADGEFEASRGKRHVRVVDCEDCTITGSPQLLRSAIENVVRNAVRYTAEGTTVEITLRRRPDGGDSCAVIRVRDHGPGVPDAALTEIFRPFYRSTAARDRKTGGTGLGLAITDRAVRLHGGAVCAANAPDGGLVVEIRLPCAEG